MSVLWYPTIAFGVSLLLSLVLGGGGRRQFRLALAGPALVGALLLVALVRGCPPDAYECSRAFTLVIGIIFGGLTAAGWLVGAVAAAGMRGAWRRRSAR